MKFPIATKFSKNEALFGIYVISYLPADPVLRKFRIESAVKQAIWLNEKFPKGTHLTYCMQNWTDMEALQINAVTLNLQVAINHELPNGPSRARNRLLKSFYGSPFDWGFFFDDDAIFADHFDGKNFLGSWLKSEEIHCLHPLNPMSMPFNKTYNENKDMFDNNWVLNRSVQTKGSSFILKNLKKHHETEIYSDEEILICEDTNFGYELVTKGFKVYRINNLILKEIDRGQSTIFTKENRSSLTKHYHNMVRAKYGVVAPEGKKGLSGAAVKFFKNQGFMNSGLLIPKDLSAKIPTVALHLFKEE